MMPKRAIKMENFYFTYGSDPPPSPHMDSTEKSDPTAEIAELESIRLIVESKFTSSIVKIRQRTSST